MIQWFRGELEASYVGRPNAKPFLASRPSATHYTLHVYRAALKNIERIEPPRVDGATQELSQPASTQPSFRQARVDDALIAGIRGPGTIYQGPIFELQVSAPRFSHAVQKDGRAYGRLTGRALLYCDLPPEAAQPAVETAIVDAPAPEQTLPPVPLRAELRRDTPEQTDGARATHANTQTAPEQRLSTERSQETSTKPIVGRGPRSDSAAPLFALTTAVAIGLGVSCGAAPALLWCLFMFPTLIARKLFHQVFPDSPYIRGFGAVLAIAQLVCVSTVVSEWWPLPCKELHVLPLIGIVAVIFPAGLLPSVVPLVFNAAGLALVLAVWCGGGEACRPPAHPSRFTPASVEHPGVPRTNEDGTWPRRPPGR